jgi:hypothetical protein
MKKNTIFITMSAIKTTESHKNECGTIALSGKAYNALDKEVARRRQAGLTASRKGVATEAM